MPDEWIEVKLVFPTKCVNCKNIVKKNSLVLWDKKSNFKHIKCKQNPIRKNSIKNTFLVSNERRLDPNYQKKFFDYFIYSNFEKEDTLFNEKTSVDPMSMMNSYDMEMDEEESKFEIDDSLHFQQIDEEERASQCTYCGLPIFEKTLLESHIEDHKKESDEIEIDEENYQTRVLKFIHENSPINPIQILTKFNKINLIQLDKLDLIEWDEEGHGWKLTEMGSSNIAD